MNAFTPESSFAAATPLPSPPAKPERGFLVLWELLCLAVLAEFGIDAASITMGVVYAREFAAGDADTQALSIAAAVALCVFEAARIPLAFALRTESSARIQALCIAGILASALITGSNLFQLFNVPAQARLNAVNETASALGAAKDRAASVAATQASASGDVDRDERIYRDAAARLQSGVGSLAALPPPSCWHGRCGKDSRENDLRVNSNAARAEVADDKKQIEKDKARQALLAVDGAKIAAEVRAAESAHTKAVAASPLHRFAAMLFGGSPGAVSDDAMAWTVRLFVGIPSVLGAFLSALLTMIAVRPARKIEAAAAAPEKTFDAPDTVPFDLAAHMRAAFEERRKAAPEFSAPPAPAKPKKEPVNGGAARPRGGRQRKAAPKEVKTNGAARPPPPSSQASPPS